MTRSERLRTLLKGSVGPADNDSRFLLDVHSRQLPGEKTMRRYDESDEVDLVVVGAGAGGSVLAQRLARRGWRIVVIEASDEGEPRNPMCFINPEIVKLGEKTRLYEEGCLSVPDVYDSVERPVKVKIEALDGEGNAFEEIAEGLLAVCIQHEMDHLNGVLFVDYLSRLKQTRAREKVRKYLKARDKQLANSKA